MEWRCETTSYLQGDTAGEWHNNEMRASGASELENFDILQSKNGRF